MLLNATTARTVYLVQLNSAYTVIEKQQKLNMMPNANNCKKEATDVK